MESDDFNHLGPTSDQHQFSPNNIRITKLITKGDALILNQILSTALKGTA